MEARLTSIRGLLAGIVLALGVAVPALAQAQSGASASTEKRFSILIDEAKASMLADPNATLAKASAAEAIAKTMPDSTERVTDIATAQWLRGEAYSRLNNLDGAKRLIDQAVAAVGKRNPPTKLNGDLILSRGGIDASRTEVAAAFSDFQMAHEIFRKVGEPRSQAIALLSIASLYSDAKDYASALRYFDQALEVTTADPRLSITIYNNRGNALREMKRFGDAELQFGKALSMARAMKSDVLEVQILHAFAREEMAAGKLDAADRLISEGLRLSTGPDMEIARAQLWAAAAQSAFQRGDVLHARDLIAESFKGVDAATTTNAYRDAHETAFEVYRKLGMEQPALVQLQALKRLDDESTKLATETNTALMAARFNSANQESRINKLKAEDLERSIAFERSRARFQQILFGSIGLAALIGVGMLSVSFIQIRRSRDKVRAANIDLAQSNSALEKALAAKTEFLATTSHEIRTPLNGILGMTQVMLADRTLPDQMRDRIGVVHGAGISMRALVDDILDVAKMETGNLTIESIPVDMRALLKDVTRMWDEQAKAKGLTFALDLENCPAHVEGDPARLRQVIFNLLSNAVKFTEAGGVGVRVTGDGERLRIAITDSGIGVSPDKQEEIFESFKQADGGTTRKYGGTGLGLAICRNLARAMGGDIDITSSPAKGSTFTINLPLRLIEAPAVAPADAGAGGLLIVDKNPIARAMLRAVLEKRAGGVRFAGSLDEAVTMLGDEQSGTTLIDEATAKAAGDAMAADLARVAAAGKRTVILWAAPGDADALGFAEAGIDQIIAKPIAGPALADALFPASGRPDQDEPLVSHAA